VIFTVLYLIVNNVTLLDTPTWLSDMKNYCLLLCLIVTWTLTGCHTLHADETELSHAHFARHSMHQHNRIKRLVGEALQADSHSTSLHQLQQLNNQFPQNPMITSAIGYVHAQSHHTKLAILAYQHAIKLAPKRPEWQNNLGTYYCQLGQLAKGIITLKKAQTFASLEEQHWIKDNIQHCHSLQATSGIKNPPPSTHATPH